MPAEFISPSGAQEAPRITTWPALRGEYDEITRNVDDFPFLEDAKIYGALRGTSVVVSRDCEHFTKKRFLKAASAIADALERPEVRLSISDSGFALGISRKHATKKTIKDISQLSYPVAASINRGKKARIVVYDFPEERHRSAQRRLAIAKYVYKELGPRISDGVVFPNLVLNH